MKASRLILLLAALLHPLSGYGEQFKPLVLYAGQIHDGSFNSLVHRGVRRFVETSSVDVIERSVTYQANRFPVELVDAINAQASPVVVLPSTAENVFALQQVAKAYQDSRFVVVDSEIEAPNVYCILFEEQEASFLAGVLAGMRTRSGVVGFVGGMKTDFIRDRFAGGFLQGLRHVRPDVRFLEDYVGSVPSAWFKPERGRALAEAQLAQGADIIFQAAGESGLGVLEAVAGSTRGEFGIGVDLNQNGLYPGRILTSVLKHVDQAVFRALMDHWQGRAEGGVTRLGIAENGVGLALDEHNQDLLTEAMRTKLAELEAGLRRGDIRVEVKARDSDP